MLRGAPLINSGKGKGPEPPEPPFCICLVAAVNISICDLEDYLNVQQPITQFFILHHPKINMCPALVVSVLPVGQWKRSYN